MNLRSSTVSLYITAHSVFTRHQFTDSAPMPTVAGPEFGTQTAGKPPEALNRVRREQSTVLPRRSAPNRSSASRRAHGPRERKRPRQGWERIRATRTRRLTYPVVYQRLNLRHLKLRRGLRRPLASSGPVPGSIYIAEHADRSPLVTQLHRLRRHGAARQGSAGSCCESRTTAVRWIYKNHT